MTPLNLNLVIFTSTAGHFGHSTLATTIAHYRRALGGNLDLFATRYCHVKVRPNEQDRLPDIIDTLLDNDIKPIVTIADWNRGLSHGHQYLADQFKVYSTQELHAVPYVFAIEDDSPVHLKQGTLDAFLDAAVNLLAANKDILHVRFQRDGVSNVTQPVNAHLHCVDTTDFQPLVQRTRDLYLITKVLQDNAAQFAQTQCEAAFRMASDTLSSHPYRYLCFNPAIASSYHIGTTTYPEILKTPEFASL